MSKVTSTELNRLRTHPHATKLYLGVEHGTTLLTAQIDGDHVRGDTTLLLKNVVCADTSDLRRGMTVSISANAANDRKISAVFLSYDSGTLTLTIGPNAIDAYDNQYVVVYTAFHMWKLDAPTWDGSQHIEPFAIMGPPRAGFINESLSFTGDNSYSPLGYTISTYLWKKFDAVLVSGDLNAANTQDSPLALSWAAAGEYLVKLKVTDDAGEIGVSFRPVLMYERTGANAPYSDFVIRNFRWNGQGWSADFTVYGDGSEDEFPPESLVVVWAEDWYGAPSDSTKQSIGGAYRGASEIVFCGWIRANTVRANAEDKSVRFTLDSIDAVMARLTMPSFTFRDGDDTTGWTTFNNLTLDKAALHIIQQRTTLPLMADVFVSLFGFELGILDVPEASLYDELNQSIVPAVFGYVAGSRYASVTIARDKNNLTAAQRAYLSTASIMFTSADWLELEIEKESFASVGRVRLEGRLADDTPVAANHPPTGPGHSGEQRVYSGLLFDSQAQATELAARIYRKANRRIKSVRMRMSNYRVPEPAFQEYFTVILQADENEGGYTWNNSLNGDTGREFTCSGMAMEYADGILLVEIVGDASVFGANGADWTPLASVPPRQYLPGYYQGADGSVTAFVALTDDASTILTDDASETLEDG